MDSTTAAILAAYRGMWTDIAIVEGHYPVDSSDPILTRHTAGIERAHLVKAAEILRFQSEYLGGAAMDTSRAIVKQLLRTVAVVSDCDYDGAILMNGRTNRVVNTAGTERELVNAKIEFTEGSWKVTELNLVSPGCTVAS